MINSNVSEFFKRLFTGIMLLICFGGAYLHSALLFSLLLGAVLLVVLFFEWPKLVPLQQYEYRMLTLFYPTLPFGLLIILTLTMYNVDFYLPLYPFFVAWSADTCGYAIGKLIGKHKMCPTISPGKSWEGFAGSTIGVVIAHLWLLPRIKFFAPTLFAEKTGALITLSLAMTTIAFLGGFFLSYLKRKNNLKDAGDILPGHGGLLDRFDSVLFVTIATMILIKFLPQ
jgi:phosphatidate cytidylyltransferase